MRSKIWLRVPFDSFVARNLLLANVEKLCVRVGIFLLFGRDVPVMIS